MRNAKHSPRPRSVPKPSEIVAADPVPETRLTLREYLRQSIDGRDMSKLAKDSGIPYSTIHRHNAMGHPLSPQTAVDLEAWSSNRKNSSVTIDAARTVIDGVVPRASK